MTNADASATAPETRVLAVDEEDASGYERPVSGDLTAETRRLMQLARRREGRFPRRVPVEPMS